MLDAPGLVVVGQSFALTVGLADLPVSGVTTAGPVSLPVPAGATSVPVEILVVADGFDAPDGWRRTLDVSVAQPTDARVTIALVPRAQQEPLRLTSIAVTFLTDGVARGVASRHVVVSTSGYAPAPDDRGQFWLDAESPPPTMTLGGAAAPADVEIDIAKLDGNPTRGRYHCSIRNQHGVPVPDAPLEIDLGDDSKTFAKQLIDQVREWSGDAIVNGLLESIGAIVASKLPPDCWRVIRAVAAQLPHRPVTLQLNSAEPYVPWELALVDPPLDPARPSYLSAQVVMGRWILGDSAVTAPPTRSLTVRAMAVMAGMYNVTSGLRALPQAQAEALALTQTYASLPAVALNCTPADLKTLLDAALMHQFQEIGGAQAVHFAGHGEVDPSRPGEAALYLNNGKPLTPLFFRRSKLGREHAPFIFLNACMVGTAGEMLGDFGGFPGNCLAGGFTGLVAPLWAVDDEVAKSVALDFYREALAPSDGRSVAEVLRDLRANYHAEEPAASYLAYVYYGNPHLRLTTAVPAPAVAAAG